MPDFTAVGLFAQPLTAGN